MTDDLENAFNKLNEATQIWDVPQFTVADVCTLTGATPKALEHFVDPKRDMVRLMGNHANPGRGKRRLFTGGQALMIKAAYVMNNIGFPQRFSRVMSEDVERRAKAITIGLSLESEMMLATYPMKNGDWAVIRMTPQNEATLRLPVAVQLLDVDRLIAETKAQLEAIVNGDEIPGFDVPDIEPEPNPYSPKSNFFKAWEKDDLGRWKHVGLTWEESEELLALQGMRLNGDDIEIIADTHRDKDRKDLDRSIELRDRHEEARLRACFPGMIED